MCYTFEFMIVSFHFVGWLVVESRGSFGRTRGSAFGR